MEIDPYVLMWQSGATRLLYWNKFGTAKNVLDKFNREDVIPIYWWFDPEKETALDEAMKTDTPLPAEPDEVTYEEQSR